MEQLQESSLNIDGARIVSHMLDTQGIVLTLDNGAILEVSGASTISYETALLTPEPRAAATLPQLQRIMSLVNREIRIYPDNLEVKVQRGMQAMLIWIDIEPQPCVELMEAFQAAGFTVQVLQKERYG